MILVTQAFDISVTSLIRTPRSISPVFTIEGFNNYIGIVGTVHTLLYLSEAAFSRFPVLNDEDNAVAIWSEISKKIFSKCHFVRHSCKTTQLLQDKPFTTGEA